MKQLLTTLAAILVALTAVAQVPSYGPPITLSVGTNYIAANSAITFPYLMASTLVTNVGKTGVTYVVSSTVKTTNYFTLPTTNTTYQTNTFTLTNEVTGLQTNTWVVVKTFYATNDTEYYITNAAYRRWITNGWVTNAAVITTNYQVVSYNLPVTFTQVGTNSWVTTNLTYGTYAIDCTRSANVALDFFGKLGGAGTGDVKLVASRSLDGTNYETVPSYIISLAQNGSTGKRYLTNLNVGPVGYLILNYITNDNAAALTNFSLKVVSKVAAP